MDHKKVDISDLNVLEELVSIWEEYDGNRSRCLPEDYGDLSFPGLLSRLFRLKGLANRGVLNKLNIEAIGVISVVIDEKFTQAVDRSKFCVDPNDVVTNDKIIDYFLGEAKDDNLIFRVFKILSAMKSKCRIIKSTKVMLRADDRVFMQSRSRDGNPIYGYIVNNIDLDSGIPCIKIGQDKCKDAKSAREVLNRLMIGIQNKELTLNEGGCGNVVEALEGEEVFLKDDSGNMRLNPNINQMIASRRSAKTNSTKKAADRLSNNPIKSLLIGFRRGNTARKAAIVLIVGAVITGVIATAVCVGLHLGTGKI